MKIKVIHCEVKDLELILNKYDQFEIISEHYYHEDTWVMIRAKTKKVILNYVIMVLRYEGVPIS